MTERDLCDSLKTLFTDELAAINTEISSSEGMSYDKPVSISARCDLSSSAGTDRYASLSIRDVGNDQNPNGALKPREIETIVDDQTVRVFDVRTIDTAPMVPVKIATTIDGGSER